MAVFTLSQDIGKKINTDLLHEEMGDVEGFTGINWNGINLRIHLNRIPTDGEVETIKQIVIAHDAEELSSGQQKQVEKETAAANAKAELLVNQLAQMPMSQINDAIEGIHDLQGAKNILRHLARAVKALCMLEV